MANGVEPVSRIEFDMLKDDVRELHKVYDVVHRQTIATEKLALEMKYMREEQNRTIKHLQEVENRVGAIEQKPAKRYEGLVNYVINTILGIAIGALATLIGLSK